MVHSLQSWATLTQDRLLSSPLHPRETPKCDIWNYITCILFVYQITVLLTYLLPGLVLADKLRTPCFLYGQLGTHH